VLNDPVNLVDPWGWYSEVIIWPPVGWGESSFGHASATINGNSYSWGPSGMGKVPIGDSLLKNGFREGIGTKLNLTPDEERRLEDFPKNYEQTNKYNPLTNKCEDAIEQGLNNLGHDMGSPFFPTSLGQSLLNSGLNNGVNLYPPFIPPTGSSAPWAK